MVYDKANELAKLLKESDEFREYKTTKEKAFENDTTASLIKEYHKLQLAAQAAMVRCQTPIRWSVSRFRNKIPPP